MQHVTAVEAMSITVVHIHLGPNSLDTGTLSVVIILRGLVQKLLKEMKVIKMVAASFTPIAW